MRRKGLGIVVELNMSQQCDVATKKENIILGCLNQSIVSKFCKVLVYSALIRPHLEYCIPFWTPHFKKDAEKLEQVQRRVTRMIRGWKPSHMMKG